MQHLPVHWTEGLFLTAQHFQAADRHWNESISLSSAFDCGYNYGLHRASFSREAIANESFQLDACQARSKQGTILSFDIGREPDRISIAQEVRLQTSPLTAPLSQLTELHGVRVYLGVPKLRLGNPNVARRGEGELHRYVEIGPVSLQDEHRGGNDQEVALKTEQLRLIAKVLPGSRNPAAAVDDDPDYELVPLAQIKRLGERGPEIDEAYIPPLLDVGAWPPLQIGILQFLYDRIGNRVQRLAERLVSREATMSSQEPGDLDQFLLLAALNEASASLRVLAFARGVHPYVAYWELVRVVGRLSIFRPERKPPEDIPAYDHDNLGYIFAWVRDRIEELSKVSHIIPYSSRPFLGRRLGMQVMLDPEWLSPQFKWYVGVHYESGTAANCRQLLQPNFLFWKMGSQRQVEHLFQHGKPGLHLVTLDSQPPELPKHNWIYFEVSKAGDAWQDVVATQTLAMQYKDALVDNKESLENEKTLIINVPPNKYRLQFVLYAVPIRA